MVLVYWEEVWDVGIKYVRAGRDGRFLKLLDFKDGSCCSLSIWVNMFDADYQACFVVKVGQ